MNGGQINLSLGLDNFNNYLTSDSNVYQQTDHVNKIKICNSRRKLRRVSHLGTSKLLEWHKEKECMFKAVSAHDAKLVESLLKKEFNPNCSDDKLRTPLHIAAASGNETIVKLLLSYGADPNKKDIIGNTPLHLAACNCSLVIITLLLQKGSDIKAMDQSGLNPLQLATSRLNVLKGNKVYTNNQLKQEIFVVITMMERYMERSNESKLVKELNDLSIKLEMTETKDEIQGVNDLLNNMANLQLKKI